MAFRESPTVETLAAMATVFLVQTAAGVVGVRGFVFALAPPLLDPPWALVTNVYAHASVPHLLGNAVALAAIGLAVERTSTRFRFHAFFLLTGTLSAVVQVLVDGLVGQPTAVLGASGAVFALVGYAVTGNAVVHAALRRFSPDRTLLLVAGAALVSAVVLVTAAPNVALVAHAVGFGAGLVAGRRRVLHAGPGRRLVDRP
ncbi:rhomboid family intramembrane serine protease [Haloglomus litoreum]|uniref:rhomboid family intramembrane serine protease n=1 Tax=Haloglomus litoreum TaxID=3034026 RepID=UPI0023E84B0C|nr:rhomboid family intramembrane serine protease [Haloglomus sp. DT116]